MTKRAPKSEFDLIGDDSGHVCQFEYVPSRRNARAIYVVFDGRRIAHRGDPNGPHRGWVSMVPGVEVIDTAADKLSIYFDDQPLN